jgi:sulfide:quinone oxidoreductase
MSKIVILGAGVSGHVAASHLRRKLSKEHEVLVVSPNSNYQWIPSNIWVGIGRMRSKQILFPLAPFYKKKNIGFKQSKAISFFPEGDKNEQKPYVLTEYVAGDNKGLQEKVTYDYLINATGPKLNFEATDGLIPGKNKTYSVCTYKHADHAWAGLNALIQEMKQGKKAKILIGTGHAKSTCQGAAFEYILNVEQELRYHNVRDMAEVIGLYVVK